MIFPSVLAGETDFKIYYIYANKKYIWYVEIKNLYVLGLIFTYGIIEKIISSGLFLLVFNHVSFEEN